MMKNAMMRFQPQMPFQAIRVGDLFEAMPAKPGSTRSNPICCPAFCKPRPRLYLKVKEEEKSFPFIEKLAKTHPDKAKELVKEFLRVWTRNHNLNQERQTAIRSFITMVLNDGPRESVTRSKQERKP